MVSPLFSLGAEATVSAMTRTKHASEEGKSLSASEARSLFPITKTRVYLNNASIAPLAQPVIDAVNAFMVDVRDNGDRNYAAWCNHADNEIKSRIGKLIGADKSEIAFVKNTTEGLVTVANGIDWREGDNVIIADIEYPSNVYCWMNLRRRGVELRWIKHRCGRIEPADIAAAIDTRTRVVSLSAVQFSNGFRLDLADASEICHRRKVLLNLDAIQWLGGLHMDLRRYHVDFLSAGGHKWLLGPIGTGFLYCRRSSLEFLTPPNVGYHSVDKDADHLDYDLTFRADAGRFEEALVNFPGLWGLDAAIKLLLQVGTEAVEKHVRRLCDVARDGLLQLGWEVVSPAGQNERSAILSFRSYQRPASMLAKRLSKIGIDVSPRGDSIIRISPGIFNNENEIETFVDAMR
jgi:cysteine desulfurase/selenocysteine lyase